jgi:hypothetical protein
MLTTSYDFYQQCFDNTILNGGDYNEEDEKNEQNSLLTR